jgi:hypothetical protein
MASPGWRTFRHIAWELTTGRLMLLTIGVLAILIAAPVAGMLTLDS